MPSETIAYVSDARTLMDRFVDLPRPVLLHGGGQSRFEFLVADPEHAVDYRAGKLRIGNRMMPSANPFEDLSKALGGTSDPGTDDAAFPFRHGFVGCFGYSLGGLLERLDHYPADPTGLAELAGGIYAWSIGIDHQRRVARLWFRDDLTAGERARIHARLTHAPTPVAPLAVTGDFLPSMDDARYAEAFACVREYIHAGDCYQVNLSRHYAAPVVGGSSWQTFKRLLDVQPGAFNAYLRLGRHAVLSFSPERFIRVRDGRVKTSPIKGTRPRGRTVDEDVAKARELRGSAKDQAENLMIVDLLRNDLGRVCRPGSIRVTRLFDVASFANVHHLVSTIEGTLTEPAPLRALAATFPSGSVTGAPKIRAMQIINELEAVGRSAFCGGIGYIDASGALDTSVAIRTLVYDGERVHCWGGGALVADSVMETEREEIEHKVGRLMRALGR